MTGLRHRIRLRVFQFIVACNRLSHDGPTCAAMSQRRTNLGHDHATHIEYNQIWRVQGSSSTKVNHLAPNQMKWFKSTPDTHSTPVELFPFASQPTYIHSSFLPILTYAGRICCGSQCNWNAFSFSCNTAVQNCISFMLNDAAETSRTVEANSQRFHDTVFAGLNPYRLRCSAVVWMNVCCTYPAATPHPPAWHSTTGSRAEPDMYSPGHLARHLILCYRRHDRRTRFYEKTAVLFSRLLRHDGEYDARRPDQSKFRA